MKASTIPWKRNELWLKTCDLIASDRRGSPRDDRFHRDMRSRFEACARSIAAEMRKSLDRLTRAGI